MKQFVHHATVHSDISSCNNCSTDDDTSINMNRINSNIYNHNNKGCFDHEIIQHDDNSVVDIEMRRRREKISRIITANAFATNVTTDLMKKIDIITRDNNNNNNNNNNDNSSSSSSNPASQCDDNNIAIFILPSYLNHSCHPNTTYTILGNYLFLYTRCDVKKDTELCDTYLDVNTHYHHRKQVLHTWNGGKDNGFICQCVRCFPIVSIKETTIERIARADLEVFVLNAYNKVS